MHVFGKESRKNIGTRNSLFEPPGLPDPVAARDRRANGLIMQS